MSAVMDALAKANAQENGEHTSRVSERKPWRKLFFRALAQHGVIKVAAGVAGVHPVYITRLKGTNARFARRFDRAMIAYRAQAVETADAKLLELGRDGWKEPVYQGGELVGYKHKHSVQALGLYLGAHHPSYRKRDSQSIGVQIVVNDHSRTLLLSSPEAAAAACTLAKLRTATGPQAALPAPLQDR